MELKKRFDSRFILLGLYLVFFLVYIIIGLKPADAKNYEISFEIGDPFNDGQTLSFTETLYVGQEVAVSDIIANNESLGENAEEIAAYYENSTPAGEGDIGGFSFAKKAHRKISE